MQVLLRVMAPRVTVCGGRAKRHVVRELEQVGRRWLPHQELRHFGHPILPCGLHLPLFPFPPTPPPSLPNLRLLSKPSTKVLPIYLYIYFKLPGTATGMSPFRISRSARSRIPKLPVCACFCLSVCQTITTPPSWSSRRRQQSLASNNIPGRLSLSLSLSHRWPPDPNHTKPNQPDYRVMRLTMSDECKSER